MRTFKPYFIGIRYFKVREKRLTRELLYLHGCSMGWRLIDTDIADPFYVTAADDALAQSRKEKNIPNTLHFYRRDPPTISIGRFGKIHEDIDLNECKKHQVKIVRRSTGGGTIYTDNECLIYSLVFDKNETNISSAQDVFQQICSSLVSVLKQFDINTTYKPPNDILLNGKKISGSAQIKKDNIILIHGTLLLDTNLELMKNVLKLPKKTQVSTIKRELGHAPNIKDIKKALKKEFEGHFDTKMEEATFSTNERQLIEKLLKERYHNDAWNYMR